MLVEQARFTSIRGDRMDGYQLTAASDGVHKEDARTLMQWGPAHDSLQSDDSTATSVSFHPLPSGAFAISHTRHCGAEYSGRGGQRVFTHTLIVPTAVLERFGNQPFRVLEAAEVAGHLSVAEDQVPLNPLTINGGCGPLKPMNLARLLRTLGGDWLARIVESLLSDEKFVMTSSHDPRRLLDGLLDLLPPDRRLKLTFTTGLKFSQRRPYRILHQQSGYNVPARMLEGNHYQMLRLDDLDAGEFQPTHDWVRQLAKPLKQVRIAAVACLLKQAERLATV